ncbi:MAG: RHS repeat protein [Gammaproteobacteria bacterium]|nr:RHS repeat protein [Gammaproteobacteria bacterium]
MIPPRCGDKNSNGLVTDDPCDVAPLTYDPVGRLTAGVNAHFENVAFTYDSVNRITRGTDAVGQTRDYRYDANGNAISDTLLVASPGVAQTARPHQSRVRCNGFHGIPVCRAVPLVRYHRINSRLNPAQV